MVPSSVGAVVMVEFPFSDLTRTKLRPAVVLADAGRGDWILCQITSNPYTDPRAVRLDNGDFSFGSLRITSFARPGKLFTANYRLISAEAGVLLPSSLSNLLKSVSSLFQPSIIE